MSQTLPGTVVQPSQEPVSQFPLRNAAVFDAPTARIRAFLEDLVQTASICSVFGEAKAAVVDDVDSLMTDGQGIPIREIELSNRGPDAAAGPDPDGLLIRFTLRACQPGRVTVGWVMDSEVEPGWPSEELPISQLETALAAAGKEVIRVCAAIYAPVRAAGRTSPLRSNPGAGCLVGDGDRHHVCEGSR